MLHLLNSARPQVELYLKSWRQEQALWVYAVRRLCEAQGGDASLCASITVPDIDIE